MPLPKATWRVKSYLITQLTGKHEVMPGQELKTETWWAELEAMPFRNAA